MILALIFKTKPDFNNKVCNSLKTVFKNKMFDEANILFILVPLQLKHLNSQQKEEIF